MNSNDFYKSKYSKYKNKYISLKNKNQKNNQEGGKLIPIPGIYLFYIKKNIIEEKYSIVGKEGTYYSVRNKFGIPTTLSYDELCTMSSLVIPLDEKNEKILISPTTKWFITDKDNYIYWKEEKTIPVTETLSPESAKKLFELAFENSFIPEKKNLELHLLVR